MTAFKVSCSKQFVLPLSILLLLRVAIGVQSSPLSTVRSEYMSQEDVECESQTDFRRSGVCMTVNECKMRHGTQTFGQCDENLSIICCVFTSICNFEETALVTYFLNPEYPEQYNNAGECTLTITNRYRHIGQLLLEFVNFDLAPPNTATGKCEVDSLVVTDGTKNELKICGSYDGHDVYYNVDDTKESVTLKITLTKAYFNRQWEIKITQLEVAHRAPVGCLEYFRTPTGTIHLTNATTIGRHLANKNYVICIQISSRMCTVQYNPCSEDTYIIKRPVLYGNIGQNVMKLQFDQEKGVEINPDLDMGICLNYKLEKCVMP